MALRSASESESESESVAGSESVSESESEQPAVLVGLTFVLGRPCPSDRAKATLVSLSSFVVSSEIAAPVGLSSFVDCSVVAVPFGLASSDLPSSLAGHPLFGVV